MVYLATWTSAGNVWAGWVACATKEEAHEVIQAGKLVGNKDLAVLEVENVRGSFMPGTRAIYSLI